MQYILNSREMKECDKNTSEYFKMPSIVLMERAAVSFVTELKERKTEFKKALIVCGTGNNGGDGLAIARLLALEGALVTAVLIGNGDKATKENRMQQEILAAYRIPILSEIPEKEYTIVIDAVFGVGLARDIEGRYAKMIACMNECTGIKVAVDIASGVSADNGRILGEAFRADITITFAFAKAGMLLYPGREYSGEVVVTEIGIDEHGFLGREPKIRAFEKSDLGRLMPKRIAYSNKGTYGKLLVIAGSVNMAGAAILAAKAAYAAGCGLVKILTPKENRIILQTAVPEAVLSTYDKEKIEDIDIWEMIRWADAVVAGPGLSKGEAARFLVDTVLQEQKKPVLLDADALNLIAEIEKHKRMLGENKIITPHLGEMARLTEKNVMEISADILGYASDFAKKYQTICVLKDACTATALPDGSVYLNTSGNAGMATAGSGDVLSGIIGALLAFGMEPAGAAPAGVYLHGMAGDDAAERIGKTGMTAMDLIDGIRHVEKDIEKIYLCRSVINKF